MIDKLTEMGYDGADIHYLHRFFNLHTVMVFDPKNRDSANLVRLENKGRLENLINGGSKPLIDKVIELGRSGFDFELAAIVDDDLMNIKVKE